MPLEVETRNLAGQVTALGSGGQCTLVVDRPIEAGGGGRGFNGGQLMYLAIAGCISNDLFREALGRGIKVDQVVARVAGDFVGDPAGSTEVTYEVRRNGDATEEA